MRAKILLVVVLSCCLLGFAGPAGAAVTYHGGPVILVAKVVNIFWGPSFAISGTPDNLYAQALIAFRNQFGTTREYNVITQYYQLSGSTQQFIQLSNLAAGTADWFDTSTPPTNVTDAAVRAEIQTYLATHAFDASTIYEVFLPSTSYSSNGSATSCGGPSLAYCTYHDFIASGANRIKYTVQPYQSCGGCQVSSWTAAQNQEHFVAYATRATVTDPLFNAWYDNITGTEMGDKCLWSPAPFLAGGFGYPYEWSNLANACVKIR